MELTWARGRLFDMEACRIFEKRVAAAGSVHVTSVVSKDSRTPRPHGAADRPAA